MLLQMELHSHALGRITTAASSRGPAAWRYKKLISDGTDCSFDGGRDTDAEIKKKAADARSRPRSRSCSSWVLRGRTMKGTRILVRGIRMSRSRKVTWKVLQSVVVFPKRIIARVMKRISLLESAYPGLLFTTNWGLPVLSHSSLAYRV